MIIMMGSKAAGNNDSGAIAESLLLIHRLEAERETGSGIMEFRNVKSYPQWHTFSNKAICPNLS